MWSGRQTDGAWRWDRWCSGQPFGVGDTLSALVTKRTTQLSIHRVGTCSLRHMCAPVCHSLSRITSLSLRHHTGEPRCKRVSCNQGQITGRLTDGPEVGPASAEIRAAGRNKSNGLSLRTGGQWGQEDRKLGIRTKGAKQTCGQGPERQAPLLGSMVRAQAVSCLAKKFPHPGEQPQFPSPSSHPLHPPRGSSLPSPWEPLTPKPGKGSERESASPSGSFHRLPTVSLLSERGLDAPCNEQARCPTCHLPRPFITPDPSQVLSARWRGWRVRGMTPQSPSADKGQK